MPSTRRTFLAACTSTLTTLTGCLSFDNPSARGHWPRRTVDNAHTGFASTDGPTASLHAEWQQSRESRGVVTVSPVVSNGILYFGYSREATSDEQGGVWLEALDAATGESLWTTELWRSDEFHYFYLSDSLVLNDNQLFVQTKPGLKAIGTDGNEQWTFDNLYEGQQTPDTIPPIVTDDIVVTGTYSTSVEETEQPETVFGLDPDDGTERWRVTFPDSAGMWQLAAADGTVYVPMVDSERLIALDILNGEERWRWEAPVAGTPTIVDDTLLVPLREHDNQQSIAAVDLPTKTVRWRKSVGVR